MTLSLTVERRAALLARSAPEDVVALANTHRQEWARLRPMAVSLMVLQ